MKGNGTVASNSSNRKDVYRMITDRILALLDSGTIPWRKPWKTIGAGFPCNLKSRKDYRGINVFLLAFQALTFGFTSRYWVTFKQAKALGGNVKKGAKGSPVVFFKWFDKKWKSEEGEEESKRVPCLRYYTVFNFDQVEGIERPEDEMAALKPESEFNPIESAQKIVDDWAGKPVIGNGGNRAYYSPKRDYIGIPAATQFSDSEEYYSTLFHELTHSTGHETRLNRPEIMEHCIGPVSTSDYSREELVAEFGAAFLCALAGIENKKTIENSAAYLAAWRARLSDPNNAKWIVNGAAAAQKAVDMILGTTFKSEEESK
jgi:antirestriction protein ArdC